MDVVSDTCAIFGRIVISKNAQLWSLAHYHLLDVGEEVVRMHERLVSQQVALMCPTWIEVSQGYDLPILVDFRHRIQQHFHTRFALAVGTGGFMRICFNAVIFIAIDTRSR